MSPIALGKVQTPYDLTELHRRSLQALGRKIYIGEFLNREELRKMGFVLAATGDVRGMYNDHPKP